jgi:drug/metabolite transporter (DMT)-like permease
MYTALGIIAIVFWSSTMAVSRSLTEQLGAVTAATCIYLISGTLGTAYLLARGKLAAVRRMPRLYLFGCGALVVVYLVLIYMAIGLASTRRQVIGVGIINYLWPGLTLIFSVPVLKKRAGPLLVPGALVAFAGAVLAASAGTQQFSAAGFLQDLRSAEAPYVFALAAAVLWGLYSNLSRRWAGSHEGGAMPVFLLAAGVVLALMRPFFHEQQHWATHTYFELAYMALLPALLAYGFWDTSMRKGNLVLVASIAYLAPVLSTTTTSVYLNVTPGPNLWIACALVVAGAVVCKLSVTDPPQEPTANDAEPKAAT